MPAKRIMKAARARGAAIMLALWALFLLSALVISWALDIDTRLTNSGYAHRSLEAEANACSGAEIAIHPGVKPGSPLLRGSLGQGQSFEARITGEGGRLYLNWLVMPPENPARLELLRKYLEIKGVDLNERDHMIDCLQDWVDPDNLVRLNGAEDEPGYKAANKLLGSLDELKQVRGWSEFTSTPNWDADLTLKSTGQIDLNWASRDVLLALPGMTDIRVDQFLSYRRGPDEIQGTEDDPKLTGPNELSNALGLTQPQFTELQSSGLIGLNDPVLRVESMGKSGTVVRTVRMVIRKVNNSIQLLTWKEL
jgi:general secretion pathway protein K